jgi:PiT family inorganic phosphate transporter
MSTVGTGLLKLSPLAALVVVLAHSIVLFLFASEGIERFLAGHGWPTIPLVPVSSSQAIIGAIIGVGLVKGGRAIRFNVLRGVVGGWVATPLIAGVIAFVALFFMENVFDQQVVRPVENGGEVRVIEQLDGAGRRAASLTPWCHRTSRAHACPVVWFP